MDPEQEELVAVARVARTRGIRGEVIGEVLTDFPERFEGLQEAIGLFADGHRETLKIEKFWFQNGRIILKFAGYDSIESAEKLRDTEICVPEHQAVELEEGEFYDFELAGCRVETLDGEPVGTVRELMRTGGTELLVVDGDNQEYLIPFAESICVEVDVENKLIRIDPPEGLLEF